MTHHDSYGRDDDEGTDGGMMIKMTEDLGRRRRVF